MRAVDRGTVPCPLELDSKDRHGKTELERARAHHANPAKAKTTFPFIAYQHDKIKNLLHRLFHGKCAYCETFYSSGAPMDVEHYRPKGAVSEDATHSGYWWLAMQWNNLLPSCLDCNRNRRQIEVVASDSLEQLQEQQYAAKRGAANKSGKSDSFPLTHASVRASAEDDDLNLEHPLLLNPALDRPDQHLDFNVDPLPSIGLALPRKHRGSSERGAVSIQIYGLNRLGLVQDRTRVLRHLEFLGDIMIELSAVIDALERQDVVDLLENTPARNVAERLHRLRQRTVDQLHAMTKPHAPYSAMAQAWMKTFVQRFC